MNLKKLRQENNLTQEDVAKIIKKTAVAYGYYESGRNEPDLKTLITLANYYNVSIDYILDRPYNNHVGYIQDDRKETVIKLTELTDNQFNLVKAYITALLDSNK